MIQLNRSAHYLLDVKKYDGHFDFIWVLNLNFLPH